MSRNWVSRITFLRALFLNAYINGQYIEVRTRNYNPGTYFDPKDRMTKKRSPWRREYFPATEKGIQALDAYVKKLIGRTREDQHQRNTRIDIYFGVLPKTKEAADKKDQTKAGIAWGKVVWVDLDGKDFEGGKREAMRYLKEMTAKHNIPYTCIVDTGNGYHVYWLLRKATNDLDRIERINKGLARLLNGDKGSTDYARILRLPQTRNFKEEKRMLRVVAEDFVPNYYELDDFQAWEVSETEAKPIKTAQRKQRPHVNREAERQWLLSIPAFEVDESTARWIGAYTMESILQGAEKGGRSNLIFSVIRRLLACGFTDETIIGILLNLDYGISERPLEELDKGNAYWFRYTLQKAKDSLDDKTA